MKRGGATMEATASVSVCERENGGAVSPAPEVTENTATDTIKLTPCEIARLRRDYVFRVY